MAEQNKEGEVETKNCKVVLIGQSGVGKTSIISRYTTNTFKSSLMSTPGANFITKIVFYENEKVNIKFEIWDTAGQERYRSLTKMFYKDANAAVLVYDITRKDSFEQLKSYWAEQIKECPENIIVVIAANKNDLIQKEEVDEEEARKFASDLGAIFVGTTATQVESINELFIEIAKKYTGSEKIEIKDEEDPVQAKVEENKNDSMKLSANTATEKKKKKSFC
jgi:small GTP-binding protein